MKYIELDRLKIFVNKIIEKKERIEKNYFDTLNIFNNILQNSINQKTIVEVTERKEKLDLATNTAISTLDLVQKKLELAINEIEFGNGSSSWDSFEKSKDLANDINKAVNVDPSNILNNRLDYIKDLRNVVEYGDELRNDWNDQEAIDYFNIKDELNQTLDFDQKYDFSAPKQVRDGLWNDEQFAFEDRLNLLEQKLDNEIEKLRIQGETLESHKESILVAIHNLEKNALTSGIGFGETKIINSFQNSDLYFSSLDKSVNNAVQKLDEVTERISSTMTLLSTDHIMNLERISLSLIKTLENTLGNLTYDVNHLRKENTDYKRQVEDYKKIIDDLTRENQLKDQELDSSFKSWMENSRKISNLEEILSQQNIDYDSLDASKSKIIENLEKQVLDSSSYLDKLISEKDKLLVENQELILTIKKLQYENNQFYNSSIDQHVDSVNLQDLIEKQANKILQSKLSSMIESYRKEIEDIKNNSNIDEDHFIVKTKKTLESNKLDNKIDDIIENIENEEFKNSINPFNKQLLSNENNESKILEKEILKNTEKLLKLQNLLLNLENEINKEETRIINKL